MRSALGVLAAFVLVGAGQPASAGDKAAYTLDANGKCHDQAGKLAAPGKCKTPPKTCKDPKTGKSVPCVQPDIASVQWSGSGQKVGSGQPSNKPQ
jgi:hypothetical protein